MLFLIIKNATLYAYNEKISNEFFVSHTNARTQYEIGGFIETDTSKAIAHFPLSRLEFPEKTRFLNTRLTIPISKSTTFEIKGGQSLDTTQETMKDFDWINDTRTQPDIYSESTSTHTGFYINPEFKYSPYSSLQKSPITFGIGCLIQTNKWICSDTKQWALSNPDNTAKYAIGETLHYQVHQTIPYLSMSVQYPFKKIHIILNWQTAPFMFATDIDNHLLRSKKSHANSTGYGNWFSTKIYYPLSPSWDLFLEGKIGTYTTYGKQQQTRYQTTSEGPKGYLATLDYQLSQEEKTISFGLLHNISNPFHRPSLNTLNTTSLQSQIKFGASYLIPNAIFEPAPGISLSFEKNKWFSGISFFKGETKVATLSDGTYTRIPLYIGAKHPLYRSHYFLQYGGGYTLNTHTMTPAVKSHLAKLGYTNANESISSNPFLFCGISYTPKHSKITYAIHYTLESITVKTSDNIRKKQHQQDIQSITMSTVFRL